MSMGLTEREYELLSIMVNNSANGEVSLSYDEMAAKLGLVSKGNIHRLVHALVERGYVRRLKSRARCIEVLSQPALPCPHCFNPVGSAACRTAARSQADFISTQTSKDASNSSYFRSAL